MRPFELSEDQRGKLRKKQACKTRAPIPRENRSDPKIDDFECCVTSGQSARAPRSGAPRAWVERITGSRSAVVGTVLANHLRVSTALVEIRIGIAAGFARNGLKDE